MPRSLGLIARSLIGLNGLLTVWCLGCCGFEPLLDASAGGLAAPCAEAPALAGAAGPSLPGVPVASAFTTSAPDTDCACQSCCGLSSVQLAFSTPATEPPAQPVSPAVTSVGISPEPQYPPPKAPHLA